MSKKTDTNFPIEKLPAGTKHLFGNMHMVPFNSIKTPDPEETKDGEYQFRNPRFLTERGQADLLDRKLSTELRESIKNHTLLNPLVCRWVEDGDKFIPMVIGGDRRYRALEYLIRKKEEVLDPRGVKASEDGWKYGKVSAELAYEFVPCQIFVCNNDLQALALAWAENKSRINLTEGHEIAEVAKLRAANATDSQIVEILQQDSKWLAETDRLINGLDANTLSDLFEGRIDRHSAIELGAIDDEEIREKVRTAANEAAAESCQKRIGRIQSQIEKVLDRKEIAECDLAVAETPKQRKKAQQEIDSATQEAATMTNKRNAMQPLANSRDVRQASRDITGDVPKPKGKRGPQSGPRKMRENKIKEGREYLTGILRNNGRCLEGTFTAQIDSIKLILRIFEENIMSGNDDWAGTLRRHYGA
jgi:hypothetical protein